MSKIFASICVIILFASLIDGAAAFGAGAVPAGNEFKEFVWRHGDITDVLRFLPVSFATQLGFSQLQRRQVYFGNWLRDFSQVIDTTCLDAVPEPVLRAIVSIMAMVEFGYATEEFDVTRERLGVYTHVEHIDNPRGYPSNAKDIDSRLRGPVKPEELEFDPKTGMKNYIANAGQGWDTAADYVRGQLEKCIELGRKGRKEQDKDKDHRSEKEAFIHLGAALHTLEDFSAHSNFIELCLHEMGEVNVFPYVGDKCTVKTKAGRKVSPLVTGTFGMLDIFHSLLGEADDLAVLQSQGTLGDLEEKLGFGTVAFEQLFDGIKAAVGAVQSLSGDSDSKNSVILQQLDTVSKIYEQTKDDGLSVHSADDGESVASIPDATLIWQAIEPVLFFHDRMKKWVQETTGADANNADGALVSDYSNQVTFQLLHTIIQSSVTELRNALKAAKSKVDEEAAAAESAAIYESGSDASDPSHSDVSKDHFCNALNPIAGMVATVTTNWTTQQIVRCWDDPTKNVDMTIDSIVAALHHPAFAAEDKANPSDIQTYMMDTVKQWWEEDLTEQEKDTLRDMLSIDSVKTRGHEHHSLSSKDVRGKKRGPGEFPGSRPVLKKPRIKKRNLIKWFVAEVVKDTAWAVQGLLTIVWAPLKMAGVSVQGLAGYLAPQQQQQGQLPAARQSQAA